MSEHNRLLGLIRKKVEGVMLGIDMTLTSLHQVMQIMATSSNQVPGQWMVVSTVRCLGIATSVDVMGDSCGE